MTHHALKGIESSIQSALKPVIPKHVIISPTVCGHGTLLTPSSCEGEMPMVPCDVTLPRYPTCG
ncbi:hypothetical protein CRENBAI_012197 [Crenichthys baileyi]|uniref:Uncharacterized protein n=1 Tax=Crenichthys baileyi TaxID=28760 RepID=A0AAV9SKP2_9TELE